MKVCSMCNDTIEDVDSNFNLKELKKAAKDFPESNKKELNQIKVLTLKFTNNKICDYCYLKQMTLLTTIMRVKAMKEKEVKS